MELEPSNTPFEPVDDKRPRLFEPLPVMLVAVADCVLGACAGLEKDLDHFYVGILGFERVEEGEKIIYRSENFRLHIEVTERPPPREDYRALGIIVTSLAAVMQRLADLQIEFMKQRKLITGVETILVSDPAGNLVEIGEIRTRSFEEFGPAWGVGSISLK